MLIVIALSVTETSYLSFPPQGFTLNWYAVALNNTRIMRGLRVSLLLAFSTAVLATILGILASLGLERYAGRYKQPLTTFFLAPIMFPIIVIAIGLLFFLSYIGLIRTFTGLVIGQLLITFPYSVRVTLAALSRSEIELERAAEILGANPWQVFWKITIPSIRTGIVASLMFSFIIAFNSLTIAIFIAGVASQPLPVVLFYMTRRAGVNTEIAAIGSMIVIVSALVMIFLEKRFQIYEALEARRGI
jgi:putative spermidine/putrescine transport system permease protein